MTDTKTVEDLQREIVQIDAELRQIAEREREAEHGSRSIGLQAS